MRMLLPPVAASLESAVTVELRGFADKRCVGGAHIGVADAIRRERGQAHIGFTLEKIDRLALPLAAGFDAIKA